MLVEYRIRAADLTVGDLIVVARNRIGEPTKTLQVKQIERGRACDGMHLNCVRPEPTIKVKDKGKDIRIPNPRADALLTNDGCYARAAFVDVLR